MPMVIVVTFALIIASLLHMLAVPPFVELVAVPVAALVAMCVMGVVARFRPPLRAGLVRMVPRGIPRPDLVVWFTGACELAAAIGLLTPALRDLAALCLAVLLVAVFPANIVAARARGAADGSTARRLLLRGLEQLAFIALCVWVVIA